MGRGVGRSIKEQLVGNDERVRVTNNRLWNDGDDLHPEKELQMEPMVIYEQTLEVR